MCHNNNNASSKHRSEQHERQCSHRSKAMQPCHASNYIGAPGRYQLYAYNLLVLAFAQFGGKRV